MKRTVSPYAILAGISVVACVFVLGSRYGEAVAQWTLSLGMAAPIALAAFMVVSEVFAPLSSAPAQLVAARVYGPEWAMLMLYGTSLVSAAINFSIARRYGRKAVRRLVGADVLGRIDAYARANETLLLVYGRTFGVFLYDFLSYAYGLTKLRFPKYIIGTAVLIPLPIFLQYLILRSVDVTTVAGLSTFVIAIGVLTVLGTLCFIRLMRQPETRT